MYGFYQEQSYERYSPSSITYNPTINPSYTSEKRMALIFYGLSRSLESILPSLKTYLFQPLQEQNIKVDIFVHTYSIYGEYVNPWSSERKSDYPNVHIIDLLKPSHLIVQQQDEVLPTLNIEEYYSKLGNWTGMSEEMTKYLIRNLVLALYSKKQIALEVEKRLKRVNYDYMMCMRPDLKLTTRFCVEQLNQLTDSNIIIPSQDTFHGCNDRLMVAKPSVGMYYCSLYDSLLTYSKETSIISEKFLQDMLQRKSIQIIKADITYETKRL